MIEVVGKQSKTVKYFPERWPGRGKHTTDKVQAVSASVAPRQ